MNTFKKYCPNVWAANCEEQHAKGDVIEDNGIENIIGHFGSSINDFSNDIYKEAIENE